MIKELAPVLAMLTCGIIPVSIVGVIQHFRHKREELQLERDLRLAQLANERLPLEVKLRQVELAGGSGVQPPLAEPSSAAAPGAKARVD